MDFKSLIDAFPDLLKGVGITLYISVLGTLIGCVVGLLLCVMRASRIRILEWFVAVYVSFFRGVPLLVQLLLFYSFLPFVGIDLSPTASAVSALGLVGASYASEILRGALNAIPKGQIEAAHALAFSRVAIWRRILLPQMFRLATPAITNELMLLIKASSLISVIGLAEITRVSQTYASSTLEPMTFYLAAGAFYLVTNLIISHISARIERHLAQG